MISSGSSGYAYIFENTDPGIHFGSYYAYIPAPKCSSDEAELPFLEESPHSKETKKTNLVFQSIIGKPKPGEKAVWVQGNHFTFPCDIAAKFIPIEKFNLDAYFNKNHSVYNKNLLKDHPDLDIDTTIHALDDDEREIPTSTLIQHAWLIRNNRQKFPKARS